MKIKDKVILNVDSELKVFYYNNDPNFKDHESVNCLAGSEYELVGYVPDKSNNIRLDEESGDFDNYSVVIKNLATMELFRVNRDSMKKNFQIKQLN